MIAGGVGMPDVLRVVNVRFEQLTFVNVVTALNVMAKQANLGSTIDYVSVASLARRAAGPAGEGLVTCVDARGLANMAWAVASLEFKDLPLCAAIAAAAITNIAEFGHQGLSNTSWAFAALSC